MTANDEQLEYWNTTGGARWVAHQEALDSMVRPFGEAALARLAAREGEHVLDVGCGCGDTLLALARAVGASGSVTGIDPSRPMLARARERSASAQLIEGDASTHVFPRKYDAMFSRFGVMFFADPIAAFKHLAGALTPGGRLGFVCWRSQSENPWVSVPVEAVRKAIPDLPPIFPSDPHAPGPFSFALSTRLAEVLRAAGFSNVAIEPFDSEVTLSTDGGPADAARFALTTTPASRLLADTTPDQRTHAIEALTELLAHRTPGNRVTLRGAAWTVVARA